MKHRQKEYAADINIKTGSPKRRLYFELSCSCFKNHGGKSIEQTYKLPDNAYQKAGLGGISGSDSHLTANRDSAIWQD